MPRPTPATSPPGLLPPPARTPAARRPDALRVCLRPEPARLGSQTEKDKALETQLAKEQEEALDGWGPENQIGTEQLAAASSEAERLSEELGIHTRVVGWWDFSRMV